MICSSGIYLGFGIIGAYLDGAMGVVWGAAFATWLGAALWWRQLHNAMHEAGHWSPRDAQRGLSAWDSPQVTATAQESDPWPGEYSISPPGVERS
jgi:hypothetical protein